MNLTNEELDRRLKLLEELKREVRQTASDNNKSINEVIEDIKKEPARLKIWEEGAEAVIQKIRMEKTTPFIEIPESEDPEVLQEMCRDELSTDPGIYHKKYSEESLNNELFKKSEEEAYQYALENPYVVYWYGNNYKITVRAE